MSFSCSPSALSSFPQPSAAFFVLFLLTAAWLFACQWCPLQPRGAITTSHHGNWWDKLSKQPGSGWIPADKWHQRWEEHCIHGTKLCHYGFSPLPLCLQTKKMFAMFLHRRNCAMQGLAKSPGNVRSIWEGWQNTKGTLQCPGVMVRVTHLLFGSPKHQVSNLSAPEALCGWCTTFHPSNICNFSFLRTTTPPNVSIYSSEIEPQLLQTMDSQFLFNIAKEEEMEWVKQNSLGNIKYNTLIMTAST